MSYFDTSIIIAYYCPEIYSKKAESLITQDKEPTISPLTIVEFASAISHKVREGSMSVHDSRTILSQFESHRTHGYYLELSLEIRHYEIAASFLTQFKTTLRTLDALHLAIASMNSNRLITSDIQLAKSGEVLHIPILLVR